MQGETLPAVASCNHPPREGAFQVEYGVLQCGGRKGVRCHVHEPLQVVQDSGEKERAGIDSLLGSG